MLKVYLDVCCLNHPFDDQEQDRVHLEAEAVLLILKRCESGKWQWVSSAVVSQEVDNIPNRDRKNRVKELLKGASKFIPLSSAAVERGEELKGIGLKTYDALHVACAEQAQVDVLLTTDDRLLRVAIRNAHKLKVRIENPLMWLQKVL
jgi:predicted nucleic acid-binding protein